MDPITQAESQALAANHQRTGAALLQTLANDPRLGGVEITVRRTRAWVTLRQARDDSARRRVVVGTGNRVLVGGEARDLLAHSAHELRRGMRRMRHGELFVDL